MVARESAKNQALKEEHEHGLTVHVFTISAGMVGVCLTGIGLLRVIIAQTNVSTFGDDLLAADAVMFMICCFLSFWSFKTGSAPRRRVMRWIIDGIFMTALALMVIVCGLIVYALG